MLLPAFVFLKKTKDVLKKCKRSHGPFQLPLCVREKKGLLFWKGGWPNLDPGEKELSLKGWGDRWPEAASQAAYLQQEETRHKQSESADKQVGRQAKASAGRQADRQTDEQ